MNIKTVNALGQACPIPVVMATRAIREMTEPGTLKVHVDNDIAVKNLERMAEGHHFSSSSAKIGEKEYIVSIEVTSVEGSLKEENAPSSSNEASKGSYVVAIGSDLMGGGDEKLGKTLIKGFIYALTQLEKLPSSIIFYNSGAKLTSADSQSLEDLKTLKNEGVDIWTCGTCVNFYNLPAPAVGEVSNMYSIAEMLTNAEKVVRP